MDEYFAAATAGPPVAARPPRRPLLLVSLLVVLALTVAAGAVRVSRARAAVGSPLHAVTAPATGGWGPTYVDDQGRPARWDPCVPIRYVVQPDWLPPTGRADIAAALGRLSRASGLTFLDEGDTHELPSRKRPAYQPQRYGERWAPLLIAWAPAGQTDLGLGKRVQGVTVAVAVPGKNGGSLVSGQVVLDASRPLPGGFGPGATEGEVLLHELAHAVGLGHVQDPTQVMYSTTTNSESEYGAGDRAGLAALGRAAGCHPAPAPKGVRG
ncbi:MAG: hypothetical protein JWN77_3340 [Frankiales bacterium]|nr:hypothetical protein [Frankiales bacterium]